MTLKEAICPVGDKVRFRDGEMHITAWSRRFLFDDDQLLQQISRLSGGELARAHIARMMLEPADVLVLDEPTNDLDLPTLGVLEQSIEEFDGPVLLVTHDRAMLERLSTQVIVLGGPDGQSAQVADLDQALRALKAFESATAAVAPRDASPRPAAPRAPTQPQRKKLSYNDQREYDGIEAAIAKAEDAAAKADEHMNDPALQSNHVAFRKACDASAAAHVEVARLYARWEELEAKLQ
jgi:ATP-binding cassette subfamily F protein uup